jgi:hypothetical protein
MAYIVEKLLPSQAKALAYIQKNNGCSLSAIHEHLISRGEKSRITEMKYFVSMLALALFVNVTQDDNKMTKVYITGRGVDVSILVARDFPEKLMTPEGLKTLHAEAEALAEDLGETFDKAFPEVGLNFCH